MRGGVVQAQASRAMLQSEMRTLAPPRSQFPTNTEARLKWWVSSDERAAMESGRAGGGRWPRQLSPLGRRWRRLWRAGGIVSTAAHVGRLGISEYHVGCGDRCGAKDAEGIASVASEREERVCEGAAEQRDRRVSVKCRQKGHGG